MECEGIVSVITPAFLSVILIVVLLAFVLSTTITVCDCGVTKPINSSEVLLEEVTLILRDPGGTNLLKWPR